MSETEAQTTKKRTKKDDYIVQGSILAAAAVLTKIIGVVYRIPLTNILGDEGNGFYGYAYQVYAIALMISSFSLPTAVSKLVSIRLAKRQRRNAFRVFICSLAFAIGVGLFISLTIFLRLRTAGSCPGTSNCCSYGCYPWIFPGNGNNASNSYLTDH